MWKRVKILIFMLFIVCIIRELLDCANQFDSNGSIEVYAEMPSSPKMEGEGINYTYCKDEDELVVLLKDAMLLRKEKTYVKIPSLIYETLDIPSGSTKRISELLEKVYSENDLSISNDGGYLRGSVRGYQLTTRYWWYVEEPYAEICFMFDYISSLGEEHILDKEVKRAIISLNLEGLSEIDKVKKIHDYIVEKIKYDDTYERHSAYNGLIESLGVCQSYALLGVRMFEAVGIECDYITGTANGESHAWNIIKVNGEWYNLDLTWDDPIVKGSNKQYTGYDYFLKSDTTFNKDHERNPKYLTNEYVKNHKISKKDFFIPWK